MAKRSAASGGQTAELFAFLSQPDLPGLPPPQIGCRHCGRPFTTAKANGRPRAFCSPSCRRDHAAGQRRAWHAARAAEGVTKVVSCRGCGEAFTPPPRRHGRAAGFCSPACRRSGRKTLAASYRARRRRVPDHPDHLVNWKERP